MGKDTRKTTKAPIRIGLVGLGNRGIATIKRYAVIGDAEFVSLCDLIPERCEQGKDILLEQQQTEPQIQSWHDMLKNEDVNLIYICTNWDSHSSMAIQAMQRGKDVACEVPAAISLQECRNILLAKRATGQRFMMLENCCYDTFHLGVLGLVKKGLLGQLTHMEGAYIHNLAEDAAVGYVGNPYPTHGLGPVCQLLGDDKCKTLVSMDGLNSVNSTLLKTHNGVSILLQFDETTPRPYNRLQTTCGTLGFVQKYPLPSVQIGDMLLTGPEAQEWVEGHMEPEFKELMSEGKRLGVSNLMNYIMDRRLMRALTTGCEFDVGVKESLLWSGFVELSHQSAMEGGKVVEIPDFL